MTTELTRLVIIGAGGFGREVLDLVRDINGAAPQFDFLGFLDDGDVNVSLLQRTGATLLGPSSRLADLAASYVIGIGTPEPRRRIDAVARSVGRTAAILTHPSATIGSDVQIGDGAVIAAGARLTTHIVVGRHAHINLNCTIGHDAIVGDFATLYAGVHLGGGVVVEDGAMLGTGCVILPNVRVGRGAVVGAGAVVVRDVEPDTTVVGAVARPTLRSRSGDEARRGDVAATAAAPAIPHAMRARLLDAEAPQWGSFLRETQHDVYHLPEYVALCATREHGEARALYVENGRRSMLLPLIVRAIPGSDRHDATSPYGYPGPLVSGTDDSGFLSEALVASMVTLQAARIVSVFVRLHPLLNPTPPEGVGDVVFHGDTVSIDLTLPRTTHWAQMRGNYRRAIKKAMQGGFVARIDRDFEQFDGFKRLYQATMIRHSASPYYFFGDEYFDGLRDALGDRLHLCVVEKGDAIAAAGLFVETGGIVQYHLGGTDEAFARAEPTKLLLYFVSGWAKMRGNRHLHLGGGVGGADDSLLRFKAGFSPLRHPFRTWRAVIDEAEYRRLVNAHDPSVDPEMLGGFFPSYRGE
jgi:sugar O-acyltransferase (sialic acid O-acetyltransferase NeuD family)